MQRMRCKLELKLTQVRSCGVTAPGIIVLSGYALEGRSLVDRDAAGTILVFEVRVLYGGAKGGELVRLPGPHRRLWFWSGQVMKRFVGGY